MMKLITFTILSSFLAGAAFAEAPRVLTEVAVGEQANDSATRGTSARSDELAVEVPKTPESAIPVRLKVEKNEPDVSTDLQKRVWLGLAMIMATAALSFLILRKFRKVGNKKAEQFNMKVLSQHYLGPRKSLAVVRVAGESILIGVTDHHISMIKSLSLLDEDIPEETPGVFAKVFEKKKQSDRQVGAYGASAQDEILDDSVDSFALSSIQDVVNKKVKGLRKF